VSLGKYFCFCASVAQRRRALATRVFCTSMSTLTLGSTVARASTARMAVKKLDPAPP
jgi:hypothetical protein